MSKPRDLSKLFTSNTNVTTDVELISTVNSASAYALSEANDYTDNELSSIDLTSTINTASAAAFSSASVYTNSAIASFQALPSQSGNAGKYLSTSGSVTSWQALDLNAAINTASAAAVTYLVDSAPGTLDTLNELAAALGDDQNFATTVTNSLAGKLNTSTASSTYLTQLSASSNYYTKEEAEKSLLRWSKTYSGSATVISGLDIYDNTLEYTPSYINLYINGILQDPSNYTASSGSTVVLDQAVVNNDVVEILSYNTYTVVNDSYTKAESDNKYLTITSASSSYATKDDLDNIDLSLYLTQPSASSTYLTQSSASTNYLTQSSASTTLLQYVKLTDTQTLTNKTLTSPVINTPTIKDGTMRGLEEDVNIVASAATGTINLEVDTASIWYYTSNSTANHTLNIRYSSSVSLNTALPVGDAITVVWMNTNGGTAYYPNVIQIDGNTVTPKWQASISPTSGNANSIDSYSFTIIKTAATPTYTVLGSQTRFA
jgi:hypothetical protein